MRADAHRRAAAAGPAARSGGDRLLRHGPRLAPPRRRARAARGALDNLAARGIALVDAFPWNVGPDDTEATDHYHGSLAMFAAAGFVAIARHENVTVVRKTLR